MYPLQTGFKTISGIARSDIPLTDDEIRKATPSVFAESPHGSRSGSYAYLSSANVLAAMRQEGFMPFLAVQAGTRTPGKEGFTKHLIRLRHASRLVVGEEAPEIAIVNSHDGSSAYQMFAALHRIVCANGLTVSETVDDIRVRHVGNIVDNVVEGAYRILDQFDLVTDSVNGMKSLTLNRGEQLAFAKAALELRFNREEGEAMPVTPEQVLQTRRSADKGDSLWKTLNVSQENLVRGGIQTIDANRRRTRTRAVNGIDQNIQLNRAFWRLSEEMAKLKAA